MKKWIAEWAGVHCPKLNKRPNISEGVRMSINLSMLIDQNPQMRLLIQDEFAGDYRFFVIRACEDALKRYKEKQHGKHDV